MRCHSVQPWNFLNVSFLKEMNYSIGYIIYHHHHHVVRLAWITLTLSLHVSLPFIASGRSSGLHPVSSYKLPSSFFSNRLVSIQVVHPYSSIDTTAAWKKLCFILSVLLFKNLVWWNSFSFYCQVYSFFIFWFLQESI